MENRKIKQIVINGETFRIDGDSAFIRYSENADGAGFTEEWQVGQRYVGFATGHDAPTDPSKYVWCKFVGINTEYIAFADDPDGNVTISVENGTITFSDDGKGNVKITLEVS